MRCVRCDAETTAGEPCPACGTRVIRVQEPGDWDPVVRSVRRDNAPQVRRPSGDMPRLRDSAGPWRLGGAKPYIAGVLVGVAVAVLLAIYLSPGASDDAGVAAAGSAYVGPSLPVQPSVAALAPPPPPGTPSSAVAFPPPAGVPDSGSSIPVPAAVAALAAEADAGLAALSLAIPGASPSPQCPIAACTPEGGAWTVADRARELLENDPSSAACWSAESVRLGLAYDLPAIVAAGYYHFGVAMQKMGCRDKAHVAYFHAVCQGRRAVNPQLLAGYVAACARTGDGCENPCDSAAAAGDPIAPLLPTTR